MAFLHEGATLLHIAIGSCALLIFWIPVITRKGSLDHKRFGRYFAWAMYAVAASGIIMSSVDLLLPASGHPPAADATPQQVAARLQEVRMFALFLLTLSILVIATTRQGSLSMQGKEDRTALRTPGHVALCGLLTLMGIVLLVVGVQQGEPLFLIFGALEIFVGTTQVHYAFKQVLGPREWWVEHLGGFLASGIAAYTAFFVFGGNRVLNAFLPGAYNDFAILFWVSPGVAGGIAIALLSRKYRQRFGRTVTAAL